METSSLLIKCFLLHLWHYDYLWLLKCNIFLIFLSFLLIFIQRSPMTYYWLQMLHLEMKVYEYVYVCNWPIIDTIYILFIRGIKLPLYSSRRLHNTKYMNLAIHHRITSHNLGVDHQMTLHYLILNNILSTMSTFVLFKWLAFYQMQQ